MRILIVSRYTTDRRSSTVIHELNKIEGVEVFNLTWSDHKKLHPLRNMFRTGLETFDFPQFSCHFNLPNICEEKALRMALENFKPNITVLTNEVYEEETLEQIKIVKEYDSKVALVAWQNTLAEKKLAKFLDYAKEVCESADVILCGSNYSVEWHKKTFGKGNFVFCPFLAIKEGLFYPVRKEDFSFEETKKIRDEWSDKFVISYVGRMLEWKGIEKIAEALEYLMKEYDDICFFSVGEGFDDDKEIDKLAQQKLFKLKDKYPNRIKSFPYATDTGGKIREYLNASDLFLYPSLPKYGRIIEQVGVMPGDSILCGVPCVSAKVGGAPDIIVDGRSGYLIDTEKSNELIDAIVKYKTLVDDKKVDMVNFGLENGKRWLGENIARKVFKELKKIV